MALKFWTLTLHKLVPLCIATTTKNLTLVDVGAGIHNMARFAMNATGIHADDSDALLLLSTFHHSANVVAFEANDDKAVELVRAAGSRTTTKRYADHLDVRTNAVGAKTREVELRRCYHPGNYEVGIPGEEQSRCRRTSRVWQTTLDVALPPESGPFVLYVKIDVEGGTVAALTGMRRRLRSHATPLVSVEYAYQWDRLFTLRRAVAVHERPHLRNSLKAVQTDMDSLGYDTYLMHRQRGRVTAVPVFGRLWDDAMEICANRSRFYGSWGAWCWNDLLIVSRHQRHACIRRWVLDEIGPA